MFGIVGGTYRNLFGRMQSATLELQYAPLSTRGYVYASFLEPFAFNTDVPLNFVAFVSRQPIQDVNIDSVGGYVESARLIEKYLRVGLRLEYQETGPQNPEDLSTIELERFPKTAFPIQQAAIGPSVFYDRRDDILDPHSGYYWTIAGKYAFPLLSEDDARYGKVSGQAAWFKSLFGGVLGLNYRIGAIYPYDLAAEVPVPIAERFYSGGSSTGRGFSTDLLGIPRVTVDYNTQAVPRHGPHRHLRRAVSGPAERLRPQSLRLHGRPPHHRRQRLHGGVGRVPLSGPRQPRHLGLLRPRPGLADAGHASTSRSRARRPAPVDRRRPSLHDARRPSASRVRAADRAPDDPLPGDGDRSRTPPDGDPIPCDPSPCILVRDATVKETGRIFLSIGYPF